MNGVVDRLQADVLRRKMAKHHVDETKNGLNMKTRRMSQMESDRLYERLMEERRQADLIVNEKRKLVNEIREREETRELRLKPSSMLSRYNIVVPLNKAELETLLQRLQRDTERRKAEANRLGLIKKTLEERV